MAFKLFTFAAVLVVVQAGVVPYNGYHHEGAMDTVAETQEHVVRNFAGTVASQSKAIHSPFASVHKQDTRITTNNNHNKYTTASAETAYASYETPYNHHAHAHEQHTTEVPAYHSKASSFHHENPAYNHKAPAYHHEASVHHHEAPAYHHEASVHHHAAPTYHHEAPAYHHEVSDNHHAVPDYHHAVPDYHHAAPAYHQEFSTVPTPVYHHGPAAHTYKHNDHAISEYGSTQKVHYSPANMVSHMSFDGFGTHWGF